MKILVSGAGIAGLACALDLGTRGNNATVVEYACHLRLTGIPIDIRGNAIQTVARTGLPKIREQPRWSRGPHRKSDTPTVDQLAADGADVVAAGR